MINLDPKDPRVQRGHELATAIVTERTWTYPDGREFFEEAVREVLACADQTTAIAMMDELATWAASTTRAVGALKQITLSRLVPFLAMELRSREDGEQAARPRD